MKTLFKSYLSLTKKQWNALVILMVLIVMVLAAPYVYQLTYVNNRVSPKGFARAAARLQQAEQGNGNSSVTQADMLSFNPNHLSAEQWRKLGLTDQQIGIIKNYEAKGGRFYTKQDLKKIYTITAQDYRRLQPYINLPDGATENKAPVIVELNSADSVKLTQINGIGPGYAIRIMRYRDRLGGFYRKEQLKEIFGIDSIKYLDIAPQVSVNAAKIKKININTITLNNLLVFPYLTYKQKNAVIEYRNQHGPYKALADLSNIPIIDGGILRKIEPYIEF